MQITKPLHPLVEQLLDFSPDDRRVFDAITAIQMTIRAKDLALKCGLNRRKTTKILRDFTRRGIIFEYKKPGTHPVWQYNRKIHRLRIRLMLLS